VTDLQAKFKIKYMLTAWVKSIHDIAGAKSENTKSTLNIARLMGDYNIQENSKQYIWDLFDLYVPIQRQAKSIVLPVNIHSGTGIVVCDFQATLEEDKVKKMNRRDAPSYWASCAIW
jgi:hypothetical protein